MNFREFFEEHLEKYPAMMLNDLEDRWKIYARNTDPFVDAKAWASNHPKVGEALEIQPHSLAKLVIAIGDAYHNQEGVWLTLRETVEIANHLRS